MKSKDWKGLSHLAVRFEGEGDFEAAIAAWRRVLATFPDKVDARKRLARLFEAQGRSDEAEPHWQVVQLLLAQASDSVAPAMRLPNARKLKAGEAANPIALVKRVGEELRSVLDGIQDGGVLNELLAHISMIISERDPRLLPLSNTAAHLGNKGPGQAIERVLTHFQALLDDLPEDQRANLLKHSARILTQHGTHLLAIRGEAWLPREVGSEAADQLFAALYAETVGEGRTLLDPQRLYVLWQAVLNTARLESPSVEIGVYRGGTSAFLSRAYAVLRSHHRVHHAIDTFEGHSALDLTGSDLHEEGFFEDASFEDVGAYLGAIPNVQVHQGRFADLTDRLSAPGYSLVHIDTDLYGPTCEALSFFVGRMEIGGVMIVDDYMAAKCPGVKQAVHEFLARPEAAAVQVWAGLTEQVVLVRVV